jgi:hypothetical protein
MNANSVGNRDLKDAARKHAWLRVKTAIRAYSCDPSPTNAEEVEAAWKRMRRIEAVSHWQELQVATHRHIAHR